jgi:hypothetical protein
LFSYREREREAERRRIRRKDEEEEEKDMRTLQGIYVLDAKSKNGHVMLGKWVNVKTFFIKRK